MFGVNHSLGDLGWVPPTPGELGTELRWEAEPPRGLPGAAMPRQQQPEAGAGGRMCGG